MSDNKKQFMASLSEYLERSYGPCDEAPKCQSPLEAMLAQALSIVAFQQMLGIGITHQDKIGNFRVDMNVAALADLSCVCTDVFLVSRVIVECDGHDFHERTKEQASSDKKRDRILQQMGHKVFRFTGSDIWKDVFSCAEEIINFLEKELRVKVTAHYASDHRGE